MSQVFSSFKVTTEISKSSKYQLLKINRSYHVTNLSKDMGLVPRPLNLAKNIWKYWLYITLVSDLISFRYYLVFQRNNRKCNFYDDMSMMTSRISKFGIQ